MILKHRNVEGFSQGFSSESVQFSLTDNINNKFVIFVNMRSAEQSSSI